MNTTPQSNRLRRIVLPLIVGALFITAFLLVGLYAANLRRNAPDPFAPYDPLTFGIPEIVAGYRILAVTSPQNSACMLDNTQHVLIQAIDPVPENPMVPTNGGDIVFELKKLNPDVQWGIGYIMPVAFDRAQYASDKASWNRMMENGCIKLGGPIILITDTPADPFAPYDPLTFGIPEILAGYRILTVQTLENTACMSPNTIRLTIQAVEPSADNPMVPAAGGDIIFEVKKIYPDVRWELQYIMPGPYDREQLAASMQEWNGAMENGCIILGGPIVLATPDSFAPYDPATFSLPEIIAGYRIVAVHAANNTPCMALNAVRLVIQAVHPSPHNPMVAVDGGDIIFEVSQLHPDIDWQLQYIMPGSFDRQQFVASMQTWNENGCTKLGGPEFTPTPVPQG